MKLVIAGQPNEEETIIISLAYDEDKNGEVDIRVNGNVVAWFTPEGEFYFSEHAAEKRGFKLVQEEL